MRRNHTIHPGSVSRFGGRFGIVLILVALFAAGCASSGSEEPGADPENPSAEEAEHAEETSAAASAGLETYGAVGCAACHGQNGEGGVGPALAGHTEDQLFRQVRIPKGDIMPPFPTDVLSDEDVKNISAWIDTLGDEMVMAHPEEGAEGEGEDGDGGPEMTPTEVAHLRLMLISLDAHNLDDAIRHVEHLGLHGGDPDLVDLTKELDADLRVGDPHDAEERALEALGPDISEHFDVVAAHVGMALSASQRDEVEDVEFHLLQAAEASVGHDHETTLKKLLDDWRSGVDRHAVIDALYGALGLEHPPH